MGKTLGRRFVDVAQKARGRATLRYEFEVIPYFVGELPEGIQRCSFAWERGTKLFVTEAEAVNPNTRAVFWKQYLRQTATLYREHNELLPKEYSFKVQSVKTDSKGEEKRKTIGKTHVDLAQFCTETLDAQPQEVMLQLKPVGKLKISIKATWLRNAKVDNDAMTEVTFNSGYADTNAEEDEEQEEREEEQDLSGFDPETGEPLRHQQGEASTSGGGAEAYDEDGNPIPRRKKRGHKKKGRHRHRDYAEEDIAEGVGDGDPEGYEQRDPHDEPQGTGRKPNGHSDLRQGSQRKPGVQPHAEDGTALGSGHQVQKRTWRDSLCCCCLPRRGPAEDPLEQDGLLAAQQKSTGGAPQLELQGRANVRR